MEIFAAKSNYSKRHFEEEKHSFRDDFERDRDRILYSKEFRRLSGKTQVFVAGFDDHLRTRLTHTLEVSQIAQTIAKKLKLNVILSEAIALAHDLGHTPFGHVGERTLNYIMNGCDQIKDFNKNVPDCKKGFKHNFQGIRVVTELEKIDTRYNGLNLTGYTLWGILHHSSVKWKTCENNVENKCNLRHKNRNCYNQLMLKLDFYNSYYTYFNANVDWTCEALVVHWADEIAQRHHDIEDALEAKIINKDELISKIEDLFSDYLGEDEKYYIDIIRGETEKSVCLSAFSKLIVNFYVTRLTNYTEKKFQLICQKYNIQSHEDFLSCKERIKADYESIEGLSLDDMVFEKSLKEKDKLFQNYLASRILNSYLAQSMDGKSNFIIRQLFKAFATNPQQLPDNVIYSFYCNDTDWDTLGIHTFEGKVGYLRNQLKEDHFTKNSNDYKMLLLRTICDYIAGMTDQYALQEYELLYGAKYFPEY